jgi:hypothetical protein
VQKLEDFLPPSGIPRASKLVSCETLWFGMDGEEEYRKHGGHPRYGEDSIRYRFNAQGYRCPEFDADASIRIVSIGCSYTFGQGLPQEDLFHELLADRLRSELGASVINWNLGVCGASNDYIARLLHLAVPVLEPDLVLILFTHLNRREYVTANGRRIHYNPSCSTAQDPVATEVAACFSKLASESDDLLNFFRNYKSVESLLAGRSWLYSLVKSSNVDPIQVHLDRLRRVDATRTIDKARDHSHPGPETHRQRFEAFWQKLVETGGLSRLRTKCPAEGRGEVA